MPHASTRSLGLDLVRAAAILLVLIDHWSNNFSAWLQVHESRRLVFCGTLGVELFFGLSGFLIGSILLKEGNRDPSPRNLGVFLVRRWMRTLPLYFLVLVVLIALFPPAHHLWGYALKYATLTQNTIKPLPPGWWYSVSWSLAVEEWFYLLFGSAAFLAFRYLPRRWAILAPLALFLAVSLILRLTVPAYRTPGGTWALVVLFRLDDIAYGVIMAVLYRRGSSIFRRPLACLAIGLALIVAVWSGHTPAPAPLRFALQFNFLAIGCVLVLPAALRLRALPFGLGRLVQAISAQSYAVYLIHLTLLVDVAQALWFGHRAPLWVCFAIAIGTPFPLAYLSFRFFESPILKRRPVHGGRAEAVDPSPVAREALA